MIGTLLNAGSFFLGVAKQLYPESGEISSAEKVTNQAKHAYNVANTTSVHRSAARTLFSPMILIDRDILQQEYMQDLLQVVVLRDIVATLTHLALISPAGVGVRVENLIGSINPNRAGMLSLMAGLEALGSGLPVAKADPKDEASKENKVMVNGKAYTELMEYSPLSIGKVINATIYTEGDKPREIPLTFRAVPVPAGDTDLGLYFGAAKGDDGLKMRAVMRRTGEITTPEWFNGTDIIKQRFQAKNQDKAGYYREAMARDTRNKMEAVRTGVLSVNSMANAVVVSIERMTQIEYAIGLKLANYNSREQIFKAMSANTIVVCNEDRGSYVFYTTGQTMPEVYTRRDLAVKTKKEGSANTLDDLVKLLNGGR